MQYNILKKKVFKYKKLCNREKRENDCITRNSESVTHLILIHERMTISNSHSWL